MKIKHFINNERGVSLVEVLASIVILSIILVFFMNFFIQSGKVNKESEEIIDATYAAQTIMEEIYNLSSTKSKSVEDMVNELGYERKGTDSDWNIYEKAFDEENFYTVKVRMEDITKDNVYRVIVEIFESDALDGHPKAKMENALFWQGEVENEENNK